MAKVKFHGADVALKGEEVFVGSYAPEVALVGQDLGEFKVGGNNGIEILVAVPSLDTGVCATETHKFNEKMAAKAAIKLSVISMDLPFAMGITFSNGMPQRLSRTSDNAPSFGNAV